VEARGRERRKEGEEEGGGGRGREREEEGGRMGKRECEEGAGRHTYVHHLYMCTLYVASSILIPDIRNL